MEFTLDAKKDIAKFYSKGFKWWKTYPKVVSLTTAAENRGKWDGKKANQKSSKGPPISLTVSPKDVLVGQEVHITCNSSGTPKPDSYEIIVDSKINKEKEITYKFSKAGTYIISGQGKKGTKGGVLVQETVTVLEKKGGETGGDSGGETGGDSGGETGGDSGGETGGDSGGETGGDYSAKLVTDASQPFSVNGKILLIDQNSNLAKELYSKLKDNFGD
jgi:hypothetical protein